jgi:hypothetical protein
MLEQNAGWTNPPRVFGHNAGARVPADVNSAMLTDEDKSGIAAEISTQIAASDERVGMRMEKIETALLTEFHKCTSAVITRPRSHSDALRTMDLELEALQGRVDKLERE